jgi:predicted Fe-S protein YdhL (DUF1289 family)
VPKAGLNEEAKRPKTKLKAQQRGSHPRPKWASATHEHRHLVLSRLNEEAQRENAQVQLIQRRQAQSGPQHASSTKRRKRAEAPWSHS